MKMTWFITLGTTAALAALIIHPVLGQSHVQTTTVINSSAGGSSRVSTSSSTSTLVQHSGQRQESQITLGATQVNRPYRLSVMSPNAQLEGEIKLNGRTIHHLRGNANTLDLSPHLSAGSHVLEIDGRYIPTQGTLQITLVGQGTVLSQQVGGSGQFSNRIRLSVQ
jgi:uncharacterized protein YpmS